MVFINLSKQENGAYLNQECGLKQIPAGWAIVPDEFIPVWKENAPFVDVECDESGCITSMTPGTRPEPEPTPDPRPTDLDKLTARVDYLSMMTGVDV